MTLRFYIVPKVSSGSGFNLINAPAYIVEAGGQIIRAIDYGLDPFVLVLTDVTSTQNAVIAANTDVIVVPVNIDSNVSAAALTPTRNALETMGIPADWVTTAFTYRQILKIIGGLFYFAQRYYGLFELRLFRGGVTLNTTFSSLPLLERQRLIDCANSFNYDISSLSGASTIRQILRALAVQWTRTVMNTNGVVL